MCMNPHSGLGGSNYHQLTLSFKTQNTASAFSRELPMRESDWVYLSLIARVRGMMLVDKKLIEEEGKVQDSLRQGTRIIAYF